MFSPPQGLSPASTPSLSGITTLAGNPLFKSGWYQRAVLSNLAAGTTTLITVPSGSVLVATQRQYNGDFWIQVFNPTSATITITGYIVPPSGTVGSGTLAYTVSIPANNKGTAVGAFLPVLPAGWSIALNTSAAGVNVVYDYILAPASALPVVAALISSPGTTPTTIVTAPSGSILVPATVDEVGVWVWNTSTAAVTCNLYYVPAGGTATQIDAGSVNASTSGALWSPALLPGDALQVSASAAGVNAYAFLFEIPILT